MKIFAYLSVFSAANAYNTLECFTCQGKSAADCQSKGSVKKCLDNEEVCQIHQRKRNGAVYRVRMGCKQHRACDNNMVQNFITGPAVKDQDDQCKPDATTGTSVCRQCCDRSEGCALDLALENNGQGPDRDGWHADIADHPLPPRNGGKNRKDQFPNNKSEFDPNDSRYKGPLTDFVRDENDSRHNPDDSRWSDTDYAGPPVPSNLGW